MPTSPSRSPAARTTSWPRRCGRTPAASAASRRCPPPPRPRPRASWSAPSPSSAWAGRCCTGARGSGTSTTPTSCRSSRRRPRSASRSTSTRRSRRRRCATPSTPGSATNSTCTSPPAASAGTSRRAFSSCASSSPAPSTASLTCRSSSAIGERFGPCPGHDGGGPWTGGGDRARSEPLDADAQQRGDGRERRAGDGEVNFGRIGRFPRPARLGHERLDRAAVEAGREVEPGGDRRVLPGRRGERARALPAKGLLPRSLAPAESLGVNRAGCAGCPVRVTPPGCRSAKPNEDARRCAPRRKQPAPLNPRRSPRPRPGRRR